MAFDVAAVSYDRFMGSWSRLLAAPLADLAAVRAGQRVLDVGSGPGALVAELLTRVAPADVAAVDPSPPFVAAVRERYPGVDARQGAAEALPFPDHTFDAALAQLVVHFMADPVRGLAEMARVTRPGGVVAASVWDYGQGRGPLGPFWAAALELDPDAVDESQLAGARPGHLLELLRAAGLRDVTGVELEASRDFAGFDDWWRPFTEGVGPAGVYLARLDPGPQAALRERCRSVLPSGPFTLTAVAWAARGTA